MQQKSTGTFNIGSFLKVASIRYRDREAVYCSSTGRRYTFLELNNRVNRLANGLMGMGLTMTRGRDLCVSELFSLVADLNEFTRFSVVPMRGHSNVAGADQVMTWQTGYPFAVSFAKGYPQYGPGEFTAVDVLARKEADAAVIISSDPGAHFPRGAAKALEEIPTIVLDPEENLTAKKARVFLPTACYGIDAPGTYYRLDNISIRAQQILPTVRPTDKEVLVKIMEEMHLC